MYDKKYETDQQLYSKTVKRLSRICGGQHPNTFSMIVELAHEIEQYRDTIKWLKKHIRKVSDEQNEPLKVYVDANEDYYGLVAIMVRNGFSASIQIEEDNTVSIEFRKAVKIKEVSP